MHDRQRAVGRTEIQANCPYGLSMPLCHGLSSLRWSLAPEVCSGVFLERKNIPDVWATVKPAVDDGALYRLFLFETLMTIVYP
jgi:hypothetical protein